MNETLQDNLLQLLRDETKPALGVTEPMSVALAAATAYKALGGEIRGIRVITNPELFKTGASVVIPGTREIGIPMAAAFGALVGDPSLGLEVLRNLDADSVDRASTLVKNGSVSVETKKDEHRLYVEVEITTDTGTARAIARGRHDNVVLVGEDTADFGSEEEPPSSAFEFDLRPVPAAHLLHFARTVPFEYITFLLGAVEMNLKLAELGLLGGYGLEAGLTISKMIEDGTLSDDFSSRAEILVAAACDARLGGASLPAMSIAGSGSHGITATLPLSAVATRYAKTEEELARAVALSFLITLFVKTFSGRLSALCGCAVAAGAGASAGIALMLGGTDEQIGSAVKNVAADVTGIICDGGNFGCALKTATGAASAIRSALLALRGHAVPPGSGIVAESLDETIRNLGMVSAPGMTATDEVIMDIVARSHRPTT